MNVVTPPYVYRRSSVCSSVGRSAVGLHVADVSGPPRGAKELLRGERANGRTDGDGDGER